MSKALEKSRRIAILAICVKAVEEVMKGIDNLGFTAPTLSKAMLEVRKDVIGVKVIAVGTVDGVF